MTVLRLFLVLVPPLLLAACAGENAGEPPDGAGDRRIEAVRERTAEADSLMRERMRDVEEAARQD